MNSVQQFIFSVRSAMNGKLEMQKNIGCGLDGELCFVQMDGGKSKYGNAGAQHGLGSCDAQRPHDLKFINDEANCEDW